MKLVLSARIARAVLSVSLLVFAEWAALAATQEQAEKYPPTIVFMSDFGTVDDSVAICKGVMYSIAPDARIFDLTHQVKPYSILDAARFLQGATPYYPAGTVFVAVVDPGVTYHAGRRTRRHRSRTRNQKPSMDNQRRGISHF